MKQIIENRFLFLLWLGILLGVISIGRIASLLTDTDTIKLKAETEEQYNTTVIKVSSERGNIYDRQGYLLAGNTTSYTVTLNLLASNGHGDFIAEYLKNIFDLDEDFIRKIAETPYRAGVCVEWPLTNQATKEQVEKLEITKNTLAQRRSEGLSGKFNYTLENLNSVIVYPNVHRYYPDDELASNIIGFFPFKNPSMGASYGIEQYYDDILSSKTVTHRFSLDPNVPDRIPDLPNGASVVLTIDRKVQELCENTIRQAVANNKARSGTVVVTNPKTGEVLAMATYPNINLNDYGQVTNAFSEKNLYNPAVMQPYEVGSVFKVITLAAAIDSGVIEPTTVYNDQGVVYVNGNPIRNWDQGAWGPQTMVGCMQHSLNTCLSWMAELVGPERFYDYLDAFGLDDPTGIELAGEDYRPILKPGSSTWDMYSLATHSFGQGLANTPIQMAAAIGSIANNGILMKPHIVREIRYNNHVEKIKPQVVGRTISEESAKTVTEMLTTSIEIEADGALVDGIRTAGKTGTGEIYVQGSGYTSNTANASFVGWGPSDDPQFLVYVWLQEPWYKEAERGDKTGNFWASIIVAPVFSEIVEEIAPYLRIPDDETRICATTGVCPTEEPEEDDYYGYYTYW